MDRKSDSGSDKGAEKVKWKELVRRRGKVDVLVNEMADEGKGEVSVLESEVGKTGGGGGSQKEVEVGSVKELGLDIYGLDMQEIAMMSKEMVEGTLRIAKLTEKVGSGVGNAIKAEVNKISRGQDRLLELITHLHAECTRMKGYLQDMGGDKEVGDGVTGKGNTLSKVLSDLKGDIKNMVREVVVEVMDERVRKEGGSYAKVTGQGVQGGAKVFVPGPPAWLKVGGKKGKVKRGEESTADILKIKTDRDYEVVSQELKKIEQKDFGIEVHALRKDVNGGVVVKIAGGEEGKKRYRREVIGRLKEEQVQIWQRQGYCQIWNLEVGTKEEEVIAGVSEAVGVEGGQIRVTSLGSFSGMIRATVRMPLEAAERLGREGRVRIGYVYGRVVVIQFPDRCFRCGETGHLAGNCRATDMVGKCFYCREGGHFARECPKKREDRFSRRVYS